MKTVLELRRSGIMRLRTSAVDLEGSETLSVHDPSSSHQIRVHEGTAYVTVEGERLDLFAHVGETIEIPKDRLAVVQGWPVTAIEVC